ncbi:hypothetical protein D3C73_1338680 [compost metagenome]
MLSIKSVTPPVKILEPVIALPPNACVPVSVCPAALTGVAEESLNNLFNRFESSGAAPTLCIFKLTSALLPVLEDTKNSLFNASS